MTLTRSNFPKSMKPAKNLSPMSMTLRNSLLIISISLLNSLLISMTGEIRSPVSKSPVCYFPLVLLLVYTEKGHSVESRKRRQFISELLSRSNKTEVLEAWSLGTVDPTEVLLKERILMLGCISVMLGE